VVFETKIMSSIHSGSRISETRKSSRTRGLSEKAQENELVKGLKSVNSCIRKFNKLLKSQPVNNPENISEMQSAVLEAQTELHVLGNLPTSSSSEDLSEVAKQVETMAKVLKSMQKSTEIDQGQHSAPPPLEVQSPKHSTKASSISAKSNRSIRVVKNKLAAANVDIELETLRKQAQLKAQIDAMQLELQASELEAKKQRIMVRRDVLEEYDVDEREEIEDALDVISLHGDPIIPPLERVAVGENLNVIAPSLNNEHPAIGNGQSLSSNNISDIHVLADSITKAMHVNRLPIPEPPVFCGNPLEYADWEISLRTLIERTNIPESDRIHYLKKYVGGSAREAISGYFLLNCDDAYCKAKEILRERFGSSYTVAESFRTKLNNWPKIKPHDRISIQKYSDFLCQCEAAMLRFDELNILNDSQQNKSMYEKLPEWMSSRWKRKVTQFRKANGAYPKFGLFVEFVKTESDIINDPVTASVDHADRIDAKRPISSSYSKPVANTRVTSLTSSKHCIFCDMSNHEIDECFKFGKLSVHERKQYASRHRLCFQCLKANHIKAQCNKVCICKKCQGKHPTSMHYGSTRDNAGNIGKSL